MRHTARFHRKMILSTLGAVVALALGVLAPSAASAAGFGLTQFEATAVDTQAGAHSDVTTTIGFKSERYVELFPGFGDTLPNEHVRTIALDLPPGLLANVANVPTCSRLKLAQRECPPEAQVGNLAATTTWLQAPPVGDLPLNPIYNVEPSEGQPAALGIVIGSGGLPSFIDIGVDSAGDYHATSVSTNIETASPLKKLEITLWGVPADPVHYAQRWSLDLAPGAPSTAPRKPFMVNPTDCEATPITHLVADSYGDSEVSADAESAKASGCDQLRFEPTIKATPETSAPNTPTGMTVDLDFPQNPDPDGLATPALRSAVVELPEGMTINPGAADGLGACTDAQSAIGTAAAASCPEAAKIGTVSLEVPALRKPLDGALYIGAQKSDDPASGKMFRLFLVADGQGVHLKLEGAVRADPVTGQLRATFADNPQVPASHIRLALKGGPRAVLLNPPTCGPKSVDAHLTPWGGGAVEVHSGFNIDCSPGLGGFTPSFAAGTADPVAGHYSPFNLRVTRADGQQNVSAIGVTLPEGVLAKLAGVPLCGDAAAATGNCPAASQVGSATVGAGAGSNPLYVPQPGKAPTAVYLAGPYKGAPYSLVAKVPAQAGPFDLGTVTVRNAIDVDPTTAQVSVKSDPLPQIIKGVPISYRDIRVDVSRPDFTLNPTSCDPMAVEGTITSAQGKSANVSSRFQVANCERLGFAPKLALGLSGAPTRRGGFPALKATLTMPKGGANIARAAVTLPKTEILEQAHIKTICTRVQYAAKACPAKSIYGYAKAWSPLLDKPLQGPVYLRSSNHELPDLVASLDGQIHVDLAGRIDAVNARIRNTFELVPDAPVSKFVLTMQGGKKGLLVNNTELCKTTPRATALFDGQNGKVSDTNPVAKVDCGKKGK